MKAGDLLSSKGWIAHSQGNSKHPLWSKGGCEPMPLGQALERAHAETAAALPSNVWCGVSVEDKRAKSRIDVLRDTPAAVRIRLLGSRGMM